MNPSKFLASLLLAFALLGSSVAGGRKTLRRMKAADLESKARRPYSAKHIKRRRLDGSGTVSKPLS